MKIRLAEFPDKFIIHAGESHVLAFDFAELTEFVQALDAVRTELQKAWPMYVRPLSQ